MKRFLLFVIIALAQLKTFAQQASPVYLTSYTYSVNTKIIGHVQQRDTGLHIKEIKLVGPQAKAFRLDKDRRLYVINPASVQALPFADMVLEIKTTTGIIKDTLRMANDQFIRNKVIAHRGAWKNTQVPENSVAALQQAIVMGCEGSEFDVHLSADGVPFINHDPAIQGIEIAKATAAQLYAVKLANGEPLPTLEAYLKAGIKQNKTKLILEVKQSSLGKAASIALTQKAVALVEQLHAEAWVDYISFDYDVCTEIMRLAPYAKVAYLNGEKSPAALAAAKFYGLDYHFSVLQKHPEWIKEAKAAGITVNVWTVNDRAVMKQMLEQGVDFITTNEPELLLELIKNGDATAGK